MNTSKFECKASETMYTKAKVNAKAKEDADLRVRVPLLAIVVVFCLLFAVDKYSGVSASMSTHTGMHTHTSMLNQDQNHQQEQETHTKNKNTPKNEKAPWLQQAESNWESKFPRRRLTVDNLYDTSTCKPEVQPLEGPKNVLVTGGGGFIGSHVARALLERGDNVVIVDEMNDYYDPTIKWRNIRDLQEDFGADRCQFHNFDFVHFDPMWNIFKKQKIQYVAHIGARAGVRPSIEYPNLYIHSNVEGTQQLLEVARLWKIKNFVYASSSSVYGLSKNTKFREDEPCDEPVSPYAATKRAAEMLAKVYHDDYDLPVTGLRFFTVFGPRGRPDMAPFKFVDKVSQGKEIEMFGDGETSRDYTYVADIVNGVLRAIDRPHKNEIFNLGQGGGCKLRDFIKLVEKHTGQKALIKQLPMQLGDVPYTSADISKAQCMLGYVPNVTLDEGLRETVAWYNTTYLDTGGYSTLDTPYDELRYRVTIAKG